MPPPGAPGADEAPADPGAGAPGGPSGVDVPRGASTARIVASVVGVVLVAFIVLLATRSSEDPVQREIVGRAAPEVAGTAADGEAVSTEDWRGSWVLVNFFATWCVPCVQEHPELIELDERHADGSLQLVSVAFDDTPEEVTRFFAERGGGWPVLTEGTGSIALDYGVRAVPESYLVAPNGQVVAVFISGVTADEVDDTIARFEAPAEGSP